MIPLIYHWTAINLFDIASEIRFFNSAKNEKKKNFKLTLLDEESRVAGIFKVIMIYFSLRETRAIQIKSFSSSYNATIFCRNPYFLHTFL